MAILRQLVEEARTSSSTTCGMTQPGDSASDYESLHEIDPNLIYCETRGFKRGLPGNDQTGAALAGPDSTADSTTTASIHGPRSPWATPATAS